MNAKRILACLVAAVCVAALSPDIARADNPIVQTIYTADPAPLVHNGRVYLYTGHDEDGSTWFTMKEWRVWSSADMVNWTDHGSPLNLASFSWASADAWAGQAVERNGKFYWYVPMKVRATGRMAIGVAVADSPTGPFRDALGHPLVDTNEIDPTVFIDDDGQAYLYWGNPNLWYVRLNADMVSYSGSATKIPLTTAGFGTRTGDANRPTLYEEGPWVFKRNGLYYNVYAAKCCSEHIAYSTATGPTGPWTYRGTVMPTQGSSFTNHPGIVDFNGGSYFFYHNGALPGGGGYTRSVAVEKFSYGSNGTIPTINMTTTGAPQIGTLNPYVRQEAETIAWANGVETEVAGEGGRNVGFINNGDSIKVKGVAFGAGATAFRARVASATSGGRIELRLDSATGTLVGTCTVAGTGGWQTWTTVSCPVSAATGTHDLFLRFTGGSGDLFNLNWWQFDGTGSSPSPSAPASPSNPASPSPSTSDSPSTGACTASYRTVSTWAGGFQGEVTVAAGSTPVNGWTVRWPLRADQAVNQIWGGVLSGSGGTAVVSNVSYNASVGAGSSVTFGFLATGAASNPSIACTSP
ncbi:glycoside hydrolase [Virgisporangium aliadipatigenens]|uniref:Glycoside hydrolase n=1 Tax=Virgisporangium aliadipatigenens TaxID=741659 RepID=A0A8J3YX53_9ACTN|nr:family 43 glycosylhydrolase [Virgisporangium aliadipatigenens]GIJ51435.1 glycoside hydrolase [Virgisporangium aliadipatigenens]